MVQIGNLNSSLSLESASFLEGVKRVKSSVDQLDRNVTTRLTSIQKSADLITGSFKNMAAGLSAAAIGTALGSAIRQGLDYASSLGEVAQQLGVSTRTLQEYRYAATQTGITQEAMDSGLGRLTRSLGQAEAGNKKMAAAFRELGVTARTADGAMPQIIAGLSAIPDPAKRAALEVAVFGKAGQQLDTLLAGGVSQVDNLKDAAHRLGIVLSDEQIQSADDTADKLAAVKQVLSARIAGVVSDNAGAIVSLADSLSSLASWAGSAGSAYAGFVRIVQNEGLRGGLRTFFGDGSDQRRAADPQLYTKDKIAGFRSAIDTYRKAQRNPNVGPNIRKALLDQAVMARDLAIRVTGDYQKLVKAAQARRSPARPASSNLDLPEPTKLGGRARGGGRSGGGAGGSSRRTGSTGKSLSDQSRDIMEGLFPDDGERRALTDKAKTLGEALAKGAIQKAAYDRGVGEINRKLGEIGNTRGLLDRLLPDEAEKRELEEQMREVDRMLAATVGADREAWARAKAALQAKMDENVRAALEKANKPFFDGVLSAAQAFEYDRVNFANDNLRDSFRNLTQDISGSLQGLAHSIKSGDWLGALTGVLSAVQGLGKTGMFGGSFKTRMFALDGARAMGGSVMPGRNYLVGERDPEILRMGGRGGSIVPNHELGGGLVRVEVVANDYFDARVANVSGGVAAAQIGGAARHQQFRGRQRY